MNALEMICRVGVKGKNVPDSLNHIRFTDKELNERFLELKNGFKDLTIELLSTQVYDDITDFDGYETIINEYHIKDVFGLDENEEAEDDAEAKLIEDRYCFVEKFIECLNDFLEYEISDTSVDFESKLIIVS